MSRVVRTLLLGTTAALAAACAERLTSAVDASTLAAAFTSTPLGFESASSSFSSSSGAPSIGTAFLPQDARGHGEDHGRNGLPPGIDFMGGGFGGDFLGGPLGAPIGARPFDGDRDGALSPSCSYDASSGITTCNSTHDGLTVTRTVAFKTTAGAAQQRPDSTTNSVATHTAVAGTITRRRGGATTVNHTSDRTVAGLAAGSAQRTVNGTSAGTESTTGSDSVGTFTATRVIGDTTSGLVIPIANGRPTYPTAGTVIRSMQATVQYAGKSPTSASRREVITYDGSATATLVITHEGTTKTCTLPLPHGRPACQ